MNNTGGAGPDSGPRTAAPHEAPPLRGRAQAGPGARLSESVNAIVSSVRQTVADFFELVALELQRAGVALMWMVAGGIFAALLIVTAWIGLMAGLALWIISLGVSAVAAVVGLALANLLGGCAILSWCMSRTGDLALPATRRQLRMTVTEARLG